MANSTIAPYLGTIAEIGAHKNGGCPETLAPEGVWEATVDATDFSGDLATRTVNITFGGTEANDNYVSVFSLNGATIATVTTTRTAGSPATNEDLAYQHALDIEAETDLDDYRASVSSVVAEVAGVTFERGYPIVVTTTPPVGATMAVDYEMAIVLNDLQPNEAFPAPVLRGENPVVRVIEAFPSSSTVDLEDSGVANSTVLLSVAVDATGWAGDTVSDVGENAKTEADWEPLLTLYTTDGTLTEGELKVQVVFSPLPE